MSGQARDMNADDPFRSILAGCVYRGLTVAMRPNESIENESSNEHQNTDTDAERTTSTTSRRRTSSSRSLTSTRTTRRTILTSTEELLGQRDLPTTSTIETTFAPSSPTFVPARLAIRGILQIRQNNRDQTEKEQNPPTSTNPEIFTYVPNTDVPARDGAIGFTASSHLFAAFVILFLFWWEWLLFMRKPTLFGYWGPLIIAGIQLYMAFDILGRS